MHAETRRGACGLPQAGVLSHAQLTKHLNQVGYFEPPTTPGLWNHKLRPIVFTLVVDYFSVEHVGEKHAQCLIQTLQTHYDVAEDWSGNKFLEIDLEWDYVIRTLRLSMKDHITTILQRFQHETPSKSTLSPHPHNKTVYGVKT